MYYSMFIIINQHQILRYREIFFFEITTCEFSSTTSHTRTLQNKKKISQTLRFSVNLGDCLLYLTQLNTYINYTLTSTKLLEGLEGKKTSVHKLLEPIYSFNILTLLALSVWNK